MFNQKKSKLMQTKGQLMKSLHTAFSFAPPSILSLTIYNTSAVTASYFHINNSFPHLYHILPKLKSNFNKWCYTPYYIAPLSFKNFLYISSILLKSSGCKFPILNIKLSFVSSVTFDTLAVDASLKLASSQ